MEFCLRPATVADAEELLAIYAPYVTGTAVTFEYDVPSVSEFAERIRLGRTAAAKETISTDEAVQKDRQTSEKPAEEGK